jgi:ParB family chromosome partitioning protein
VNKPALHIVGNDTDSGLGSPLPVKLSRIRRFEEQPRRQFNQKGLEDLADDLLTNGQKTPVRVCKHSSEKGVFVLIGGERRWRAFGIIRDRGTSIDPLVNCFIDTIHDEQHHFREALLDNLHREDLVPLDEAAAYKRLYDESSSGNRHAKITEIAGIVRKSTTHIENYIYMDSLPEAVKKFMDHLRPKDERLTTTAAIEIARSTNNQALQLTIAKEAIERNLGVIETRTLISLKTGKSGYGISGRLRKPSDDYKALKNFIGVTLSRARRIQQGLDIDALYNTRDDETGDRKRDTKLIKQLLEYLDDILTAVGGEKKRK